MAFAYREAPCCCPLTEALQIQGLQRSVPTLSIAEVDSTMASVPLSYLEEVAPRSEVTRKHHWLPYVGLLFVITASVKLHRFWQDRFDFDDAYMYVRYAHNFRQGWGMAWNPGGPHTFGITSLPWFFVILAGSYFVLGNATLLTVASCSTGVLAIAALCLLISSSAKSSQMRRPLYLLPTLALPLLLNWRFGETWANGMETMLGMFSLVLFLGAHKRFAEHATWTSLALVCLSSAFCVLVRPELLLVVLTLPVLSSFFCQGHKPYGYMPWYVGILGLLLSSVLLMNKRYFNTPVPLAFYLKAMHGYAGYRLFIDPWALTAIFFSIALPFTLFLAGLATRRHVRMLAPFFLPLLLEIAYLATVTQIMGGQARYYIPLLPLIILPAMLLLDEALLEGKMPPITHNRVVALILVVLLSRDYTQQLTWYLGKALVKTREYYAKPVFLPSVAPALPQGSYWKEAAEFAHQLPPGTIMAASEVGILGASAPQVSIVDLAGLNDAHLALHPADVEYVLSQKPDVIWLPHSDYTRFYGSFASAPTLLQDYDLYAGALDFGLAIRRSSRAHADFEAAVDSGWHMLYPGYRMQDYKVQQVYWDPHIILHGTQADVLE